MSSANNWKQFLLQNSTSSTENRAILASFEAATNETACLAIAKTLRAGTFLVKASGQDHPTIIHSFSTAPGNDKEVGYGNSKPFFLSGLGPVAFPMSFRLNKLFKAKPMYRYLHMIAS